MKQIFLWLLIGVTTSQAQPKPDLQLIMPNESYGGSNGSSVVWHPLQKRYIAAMAGNAGFPLSIFDAGGKRLSADDQTCQYDIRGLWFHPEKQLVQGNAYDNGGWFAYSIGSNFKLAGKILHEGSHQPGPHSVGTYYASNKRVGFLNGNKITFYDPNTGEVDVEKSVAIQPLVPNVDFPDDLAEDYNETSAVFTGIPGKEIGLLNINEAKVELYDLKTGKLSGVAKLPDGIDYLYSMFNFAYANQLYWFYDKNTRIWNGFKLTVKNATAVNTTPTTPPPAASPTAAALEEKALALKKQRQYVDAIVAFQAAIKASPEKADLYQHLGDCYRLNGNTSLAQSQYLTALQKDPNQYWANYEIGVAYSLQGDYANALSYLQRAVQRDPKIYEGMLELGYVQYKLKRNDEALATLQKAAVAHPQQAGPHKVMGDVYRQNYSPIKTAESMQAYQKAIALDKTNVGACYGLGWLYNSQAQYDNAVSILEQALQKNRKEKNVLTEIGYSYYAKKSYMTSLTFLNEALAIDPNLKTALYYSGLCQCGLKDKAAAQTVYSKLLGIDAANAAKLKTAMDAL
jgi:tetratricopeptide (TPR) repeat protein